MVLVVAADHRVGSRSLLMGFLSLVQQGQVVGDAVVEERLVILAHG
jgi:hypothetical protein